MKKILKIKGIIIITASMFLMSPVSVFAYKLMEPLPGLDDADVTLSSYLTWLFPFILTVIAILAVIMIVIGGLELAGGGSESLKTSGKKRIEGAVYGLVLAVSAYLILYTINPNLVNMSLDIDPVTIRENDNTNDEVVGGCRIEYKYNGESTTYATNSFASDTNCATVCNNIVIGFRSNPNITDIVSNNCNN